MSIVNPSTGDAALWSPPVLGAWEHRRKLVSGMAVDPGVTTGVMLFEVPLDLIRSRGSGALDGSLSSFGVRFHLAQLGGDESRGYFDNEESTVDKLVRGGEWFKSSNGSRGVGRSSAPSAVHRLVCEDFILRERTMDRSLLSPVRLTSLLHDRLTVDAYDWTWHFQSPADKSIITDDVLKRQGLYIPGNPHAMDAARHAVLFLRKLMSGGT